MDSSLFSAGSENLYKYLVSIGILLIVLTVVYPLNEKQELEMSLINLEGEAIVLNYNLKRIKEDVDTLSAKTKTRKDAFENGAALHEMRQLFNDLEISQLTLKRKFNEIEARKSHIQLYNTLFWIFFPVGVAILFYGFIKWKKSKKIDDEILELEKKKLKLEVKRLKKG